MRKLIPIIVLLLFYSINPVQADDNLKTVYKDGIEHNNVFALLYIEEQLEKTASNYSVLGITAADFGLAKATVCKNYLAGANSLTLSQAERGMIESACFENRTIVSAF